MSQPNFFEASVALNYEKYTGPATLEPFALDLAGRLNDETLKNVLEIACGTGRVTRHLVQHIPPRGTLIATDISADMIEVARSVVTNEKISWQVADAQELPFDDDSFDHVVCQFGLMFFPDKSKALREIYRVLRQGGKFLFNVWDSVEKNPRTVVFKKILDEQFDDAPAETRLPHSLHDKNLLRRLLEDAGFNNIGIEEVTLTGYQHPDDTIAGFSKGAMVNKFLSTKTELQRTALNKRLKEELINTFGKDGMRFPMRAIVAGAVKI
jgi:ubiquinone/menaquinone biosynthesis C-methylase UbiE